MKMSREPVTEFQSATATEVYKGFPETLRDQQGSKRSQVAPRNPQAHPRVPWSNSDNSIKLNGVMTKGMGMKMKLPHEHGHQHGQVCVLRASSHISSLDPKQRRALGHKNFLLSAAQYITT